MRRVSALVRDVNFVARAILDIGQKINKEGGQGSSKSMKDHYEKLMKIMGVACEDIDDLLKPIRNSKEGK